MNKPNTMNTPHNTTNETKISLSHLELLAAARAYIEYAFGVPRFSIDPDKWTHHYGLLCGFADYLTNREAFLDSINEEPKTDATPGNS